LPKPAFIILTGWGTKLAEEERLDELGVDLVMRKPVKARRLTAEMYELVRERGLAEDRPKVSGETGRNPA